ncbi:Membrane associated serine protease, rhomboid family [Saccharicrinis carchari]|uniref:Membrane associated serine protease, rhomboid family n=1 Tax=Saccharicrinis carchari TaxID=1168039 RepID=A0A521EWJ6_SACCC|nr:rhomboid family intramembrane serine protease [Saccharicrinis carchari]SMO87470.1 Membrane associated serine protease, rhomboid family [Saccharicrinis carchari]
MAITDEIKDSFRRGGVLTRLIYINLGVFLAFLIIDILFSLFNQQHIATMVKSWFSVPADPMALLLKPWSIFTYMFLHYDFLHILFNMLYLYWFGRIFLQFFNPRQLLGVYFMGGLAGALLYMVSYNIFPALSNFTESPIMMGASASVMAIIFGTASYSPNYRVHLIFLGPVKLMYLAIGMLILDLIAIPTLSNTGGHLAHIGGALLGMYFASRGTKGKDITMRFNRFMDSLVSMFSRKPKMRVTHSNKPPTNDMEYNARKRKKQGEIDRILDKIKTSGYDSLSKQEKDDLFNASNN